MRKKLKNQPYRSGTNAKRVNLNQAKIERFEPNEFWAQNQEPKLHQSLNIYRKWLAYIIYWLITKEIRAK